MTNDNGVPSGRRRRTRHRLTDRDRLAEQLTRHWGDSAVATYALAARDLVEQHVRIGPVDTWRRAAVELACAQARPQGEQAVQRAGKDEGNLRRLRKKLSWNFGVRSRGPRWPLVELLVRHLVPAEEQRATRIRLADLHRAARGRHPKGFRPDVLGPVEAPAAESGGAVLAELERQKAELRDRLDASQAENLRLRADLAQLTDRLWQVEPPSDEVGRSSSFRTSRNEGHFGHLTGLDEDAPVRRKPSRADLVASRSSGTAGVTFWLEGFGHDGARKTAGPVDRHTPSPRPTDRFPQPGTGRPSAPNTAWRRPPA